ncbi:hypothetical protein niasHT_019973 [Heterodera trifolii]|uniref:Microtubule-actin cross-linking factor 1 n=1 Tax=Heterodera trifolii TaxID=157864 RepID=A0ABD2LH17_9BILA
MPSSNGPSSATSASQNAVQKASKSGTSSGSGWHHQNQNRPVSVVTNVSRFTTFVYAPPTPATTTAVPRSNSQMTSSSQSSTNGCVSPPTVSSPSFSSSSLRKNYENGTSAGGGGAATPAAGLHHHHQRHHSYQQQQQQYGDAAETECLEHYESNLEKYKDERDTIQKKTFTKWVNQHLIKTDRKVEDLFMDLRDGFNLITLLEVLTDQHLHRENGTTRFHRIQNVQRCLDTLRRRNVKLVNIRPEDIVEGNGKLTLGLIWTIILSFQVSMINQREIGLKQALAASSRPHQTSSASDIDRTTNNGTPQANAASTAAAATAPTSHLALLTAREALLKWARHVTSGYPGVNVANFSGSWKDGLAFCALLHFYRPGLINWEEISAQKPLDRLRNAFDAFESEFGVAKLLDPEDVCEVDTPDERSLITYISQLHNRLVDEPKGNLDDLVSRLTRGIGITNEKLDHLLTRIDAVDAAAERGERIELLERQVREIGDDLHMLKPPIDELFLDVDTLRQHRHADAADFNKQVIGLEQRRTAYLGRLEDELMRRLGLSQGARYVTERYSTASSGTRGNAFRRVEDAIQWIRDRMHKLNSMQFSETLEVLEQIFEQHKLDNRDIQDFRQTVDECIARQAEVSAEDSYDYCELLKMMESEYQQLRELSAGRMVDLDSLIAFIRAAQLELLWIHQREELEVTRNWSDLERLDIPMLQNYFKQLLHEIELHEKQFNDVHNQGAALINQRHPAGEVIEVYLRTMQNQWDWMLNLSKCLEGHLRDAYNAKAFVEESEQVEQQMQQQLDHLDREYSRTDFSLDDGEQMLRQLDSVREYIQQLHARLLSLTDRCAQISPLWQRGERISKPLPVMALCEYKSKDKIHIRQGDECTLLDNHDQIQWRVRGMDGVEASVPSVVFRIPPPDPRLASFLSRLHNQFEKLRKLWDRTHHLVRYNMVLNTMRTVRAWDLDTFLSIPSDQRDEIIKALNEDVNKLLSEMDPNDPLAKRLKDELRMTNEHFYDLLARAQKEPEPDYSNQFDAACAELVRKFEEGWKQLNHRVQERVATNLEELERQIKEHKAFEDALQTLDVDVSNVKELYRQLPHPTPTQRAAHDNMVQRWQDIWELSRMYVERLKGLESVLNGLDEVTDIVRRHEITLASFDDMPAALERLRGVHAQLLELNMVLQQQENIVKKLNRDTATLRQHVARTRFGAANHPDVDQIEDRVSQITVRWDNVNSQVAERLRIAEEAQQTQMVYRSQYTEELGWLDRVEATIDSLRRPEELRPEELQGQLDQLVAEYAQLQEHTATIENINKEGGKFIRDAKSYDLRLSQYHDSVISIHGPGVKQELHRQVPQPKTGATVVTEELELLNRRFAELSSVILERKNIVNVLIQNWRRKQQEEEERRRAEEEAKRRAFEAARRKALEEADRLRREREASEVARKATDEAERMRRLRDAEEEAERLRRLRAEDEERRRLRAMDEEERRRRREQQEAEEAARRKQWDADEAARLKRWQDEQKKAQEQRQAERVEEVHEFQPPPPVIPEMPRITEHEEEPQMFQEETVTKTQFYEMEGILHKQTGEILTFVEAIRQGLLNLSAGGEFFDIVSGQSVSLDKAVDMGLISENITEILNGRHGIKHPETGQEVTLLEAIQIGLYDPDSRQLRDIKTGELLSLFDSRHICPTDVQHRLIKMGVLKLPPMELEQALKNGVLNPTSGVFRGKYVQDPISLRDALAHGYIQFPSAQPLLALTLTDCIVDGFIDAHAGEFVDRFGSSGERFTLRDALDRQRPLVKDNVRECINTATNQRLTIAEAMLAHALNPRSGKFTDLATRAELSLRQAYDQGLIQKSQTLTEVVEKGLLDTQGHFSDRGNRFTLMEAINSGLLDAEVRHIVSEQDQEVISIGEALERGLLSPDGKIVLGWAADGAHPERQLDLHEAHRQGLLTRRARHTIFDVKGVKNAELGTTLSFNEAVEAGIMQVQTERVLDQAVRQTLSLSDASRQGLVDSALADILMAPCGLSEGGTEVSLIRAVSKGLVDASKGVVVDPRFQRELSVREAYDRGMFTSLRAAMHLAALLDVHPSLMTPVKKKPYSKKRIQRPGQPALAEDQVKVTLAEAMRQGLIDARTQRFRQGNQEMSLDDALHRGLIDPQSEWIVPSRASGIGPTIEERTQETVTETGQQLAPKIFPDKELQESVNTVKRVRRTETSAVGGPGGVSVYRAVTGGKGSIEVPAHGYHVLEAERKGLLNLANGTVSAPGTDKQLSLEEAVNLGILDARSLNVRDPNSGRMLSLDEALQKKVVDRHGHLEHRGRRLTLREAIDERVAHVEAEPPATIGGSKKIIQFSSAAGPVTAFRPVGQPVVEEHEQAWSFDSAQGLFVDMTTNERIPLESAVRSGLLSSDDLRVRDALTGREMSLDEAQKWGIVNMREAYYLDKTDNKRYSLAEAARQHRIYPTGGVPENAADSLHTTVRVHTRQETATKEAVDQSKSAEHGHAEYSLNRYVDNRMLDPDTGLFSHPDAQKQMTLKELIVKGYLNPYNTRIIDRASGTDMHLLDAIREHIVDDVAGTVRDTLTGRVHDFATATRQGLVKEDSGVFSADRRTSRTSLGDAGSPRIVERKLQLTPYAQEPFRAASSTGSVGSVGGGTTHGQHASLFDAAAAGPVVSAAKSRDVWSSSNGHGTAITPATATAIKPNERMVDLGGGKTVKVNVVRDADGLEKGEYFDPASNMKFTIQLHGDPVTTQTSTKVRSTSQVQSVELEPHAQFVGIDQIKDMRNGRVMSLADAQRLGIARVDRKGKQTTREYSAFRSSIDLAVNKGVLNARGERVSLEEAIRQRLIDIRELKYIHPRTGEAIDLTNAANQGLVDVTLAETLPNGVVHPGTGEKVSVRRAVEAGIVDSRTGEVRHPFTGERLSWVDLTRKVYSAITQNGVYDPRKGYAVSVASAFADGLIDTRAAAYLNPITQEQLSLEEAHQRGIIDAQTFNALTTPALLDHRTHRRMTLVQAVDARLIDPRAKTVQISPDRVVPVKQAVDEGALPRDVGEQLQRVDKLTFVEAVSRGLIDAAQGTFTDAESGRQMSIADAVSHGLIDTGSISGPDADGAEAATNLARIIQSDEFDERSGRVQDPQTRLYLPFGAAVNQRLVDPDSLLHDLDSSKTMTLREALSMDLIDSHGRYVPKHAKGAIGAQTVPLKEAVQRGLIALIGSPMQAALAVSEALKRRDVEGYKFRLEPLDDSTLQRMSSAGYDTLSGTSGATGRPRGYEETVVRTRRAPEPSLSVRVRSSDGSDSLLRGSRARSDVDPLALVDFQTDFLKLLQAQGFDVDEKCVENPSTMRLMSIREAVESGLFDVTSGELINPISGRHYPVQRAVQMRLVQTTPERAQQLEDALAQAQHQHSHIVQPLQKRPSGQFSPSSISLGSGGGGGVVAGPAGGAEHGYSSYSQRRSSYGVGDSQPVSPLNGRHSWSSRNISWRGPDTTELRAHPEIVDVRHASVERGANGVPPGMDKDDFHREFDEFRRDASPTGGRPPMNTQRTRTFVSPDGRTRTTTHYSHQRSEY